LFGADAGFFQNVRFGFVHADQFSSGQEDVKVFKSKVSVVAQVFQHAKDVVLMLLGLGALWAVTAIFHLQFVKGEPVGKFIQLRRAGVGDVKPRNTGERLLGWVHQQEV